MLHAPYLLSPHVLQFKLDALNGQQEAVKRVVFLVDVWAEHQVDWPLTAVYEGQTTPRVLLIGLHTTFKDPIFDQKYI